MKNILVLTIGQRDLQIVTKNKYYEIEKKNMKSTQKRLGELLEKEQLEWLPFPLIQEEGKEKGYVKDLDINEVAIKQVTFPIIENLLMYLKKRQIKIDKFYLLYTNRQHFIREINHEFIMGEPYLTNKIFNYFYNDIIKYYELNEVLTQKVDEVNIGKNISEINYDKLYPFFDDFFKKLDDDEIKKVYVASAGGIPSVRNVIEDLITLKFPNKSVIFEQNKKDDINLSKFHQYKEYYRNYNILRNNIKEWDFTKALRTYQQMSNNTDNLIVIILNISNNIFFIGEDKAIENINELVNIKNLPEEYKKKIKKIKTYLKSSKENSCFMIFLKFLQVYKQGNYWAATTILITLFETFIEETLSFYYPNSVVVENKNKNIIYKFFNWEKINPNWDFKKPENKELLSKNNNKLLRNNWASIREILLNILPNDKKNIFGFIKNNLLNNAKEFKINRNNFVHHGISISKSDIDELLKIEQSNSQFFGSSILNEIFKELKIQNPNHFNWLEYFEEILLKEIKTIKSNIK